MHDTKVVNARPGSWVIGTSLGFEAAVLAVAAWVFVRGDYRSDRRGLSGSARPTGPGGRR